MAIPVVLPKLGNTVESSIILQWLKAVGDEVAEGDVLCEVETDKATVEVESPVAGTLLAHFFEEGDDVPVLVNIAAVGTQGESVDALRLEPDTPTAPPAQAEAPPDPTPVPGNGQEELLLRISPRARKLAQRKQIDIHAVNGTGPMGRIIERDIEQAIQGQPSITPVAQAMLQTGEYVAPQQGTGTRGRITKADLIPAPTVPEGDEVEAIPLRGIRKTIARRMLASLQTTAQLTLNASANAQGILDFRNWLKASPASIGLASVTINDLMMYAVVRTLVDFPELNTVFESDTMYRHRRVHLGFAVDTTQGLMVPVIRRADQMNLMQLADEAHRLAQACLDGKIMPDELTNGTFTVSNLGSLGVTTFTPVLNSPQVGILGVGSIKPEPVPTADSYEFVPHVALSLTINHQVVDGAPAARFLQQLSQNLANVKDI